MNSHSPIDSRVTDQLSAFLDGALSPQKKAALERDLAQDAGLRQALEDLRLVRDTLRSLPMLHPPRPLILTPEMAGLRPAAAQKPAWHFALGSALAALAFFLLLSRSFFTGQTSGMAALPAADGPMLMMEAAPAEDAMRSSPPAGMGAPEPAPTAEAVVATDLSATETPVGKLAATREPPTESYAPEEPQTAPQPLRTNGVGPDDAPVPTLVERLEEYRLWLETLLAVVSILLGILAIKRSRQSH